MSHDDNPQPGPRTEPEYVDLPRHRVRIEARYFDRMLTRLKPPKLVWLHAILNRSYPGDGRDWIEVPFPHRWFGLSDVELRRSLEWLKSVGLVEHDSTGRYRIDWPAFENLPDGDIAESWPRLTEIAGSLPLDQGPHTNAEVGYKVWRTRRANAFKAALQSIQKAAESADLTRMVLGFGTVMETVARAAGENRPELSRGYTWATNSDFETGVAFQVHLLTPGLGQPYPPLEVALGFAADMNSGWLDETAMSLGLDGSFSLAPI